MEPRTRHGTWHNDDLRSTRRSDAGRSKTWWRHHPILLVFCVALILRGAAILLLPFIFDDSPVLDDITYSTMAKDVSTGSTEHWDAHTTSLYNRTATLTLPLSLLYSTFGPHQLVGQIFIALIGALTAAAATRLSMEMMPTMWALGTGVILALLPSQVLWSSLVLKDPLVWLVLITLALIIAAASRTTVWNLMFLGIATVTTLLLLAHLRQHTLVVACLAVALSAWFGIKATRLSRGLGALLIGISVPWILGLGPAGIHFIQSGASSLEALRVVNAIGARSAFVAAPDQRERERSDNLARELGVPTELVGSIDDELSEGSLHTKEITRISRQHGVEEEDVRRIASELGRRTPNETAAPASTTDEESTLDPNLRHLPRGLVVMVLEPIPGRATESTSNRLAQFEAVVWYPILALALLGLPLLLRRLDVMAFPLLAGGGVLVMYALSEGNIGTAYRHRGEFVWVVAVAAAAGAMQLKVWLDRRQAPDRTASRSYHSTNLATPSRTEKTGE